MAVLLVFLKVNIGISQDTTAYDTRLESMINQAIQEITQLGITYDATSALDNGIVVEYATWLWMRRRTGEGMPRMLRLDLNNRLFAEKMNAEG